MSGLLPKGEDKGLAEQDSFVGVLPLLIMLILSQ
jgi:hypothetical protein